MATAVFDDLVVPEGEVRTYTQNSDSGISGALLFAPPDTSGEPQPSLTNFGEMRFQADEFGHQWFIRFATYSSWDDAQIRNYGTISAVVPTASGVTVLYAPSWSPDLWNAGTIVAEAKLYAIAFEGADSSLEIDNLASGSISAKAAESATGLFLANGGTITNGGEIVATALGGSAYAISLNSKATVVNSGLIQASDNSANPNAVAITFYGSSDGNTIFNSGTIRGDLAIRENNPYEYDSRAMVRNTGLIEGHLVLAHGNDKVINTGQIVGDVDFGAGFDFYDGRLGTIVGTVLGGEGHDLLLGGTGRDTLNGGVGADALFAHGGDTLTGGMGGDTFVFVAVASGTPAEMITDFSSGIDRIDLRNLAPSSVTIDGSTITAVTAAGTLTIQVNGTVTLADILTDPTAAVTGTSGHDTLVAGPVGTVLSGGAGADLLVGGGGNDRLDGGAGWRDSDGRDYGDMMRGGAGDDTYAVNQHQDEVIEEIGGGFDTIEVDPAEWGQFMYELPDHIERVIGGSADGNALDNVMIGGAEGNLIHGRDGNDTIDGGSASDQLYGDAGDDTLYGNGGGDVLIAGTGIDSLNGGYGDDGLYFGAHLTTADSADGGAGTLDQLGLQGVYSGGMRLGANSLVNVEMLVLLSGDDSRFGDPGTGSYSYDLTTVDANVGAGETLRISFNTLRAGENVTFDGSAETDGAFLTFGGRGEDALTGGAGDDGFYFGEGRFGAGEVLNGSAGSLDQLGLQGDYAGANAVVFGGGQLAGIEMIVCLTAADARFGGNAGALYDYDLTMHQGNLANGALLEISANTLIAGENLAFDASAETDGGRYTVYSGDGDDTLVGGAGRDTLHGAAGADTLTGRAGADLLRGGDGDDVFAYLAASDSTSAARDSILDFAAGDTIDLSAIDARAGGANNSFTFIGDAAFGNNAGQLRAAQQGGANWLVEGDTNGDGLADFALLVTVTGGHAMVGGDFVL